MAVQLIALWFSPWSLAARWALEHHQIDYRYREYLPMLGEPWLRLKSRRWRGLVSVPVLDLGRENEPLRDSFAIARYAERHGIGPTLFPDGAESVIESWNERAQSALARGRVLTARLLTERPGALRENTPHAMRWIPGVTHVARMTSRHILRKYPVASTDAQALAAIRTHLRELRAALAESGGEYLIGAALSYADIIAAIGLQGIRPPAFEYLPMGPETRECWTRPELAEEFADLLSWRDRLYARHYWRR